MVWILPNQMSIEKKNNKTWNCLNKISDDLKKSICYNYNKKGYFVKSFLESKNWFQSWQPAF